MAHCRGRTAGEGLTCEVESCGRICGPIWILTCVQWLSCTAGIVLSFPTPPLVAIVLQGEAASLQNAMTAVADCIERPDGCRVVPGLPIEQYYATLTCSIAGGLVAGFVSKIEAQGGRGGGGGGACIWEGVGIWGGEQAAMQRQATSPVGPVCRSSWVYAVHAFSSAVMPRLRELQLQCV
jgi:hypothetical protein